jgi:hypothetical protein
MVWTPEQRKKYRQRWWAKQPNGTYREYKLKSRFNLTLKDYDRMLVAQGGTCYFCSRTPAQEPGGVLCVDHDHKTGRVRGLLCKIHNRALANFGDDVHGFWKALNYVGGFTVAPQ